MASKVLLASFMLLFSVAIVGAIPKYGMRSENQNDVNCTDVTYQFFQGNVCRPFPDILNHKYLTKIYPNATEDFYRNVSQQLTAFCASQCKSILVAFLKCQNETDSITGLDDGTCGKINQQFCYVHHLRGTTAGTIVAFDTLRSICPYNSNTGINYCLEGTCQENVTQYADYMDCCTGPILGHFFNLTSCDITDITPCSSGTVALSSSVFIMVAMVIIQIY